METIFETATKAQRHKDKNIILEFLCRNAFVATIIWWIRSRQIALATLQVHRGSSGRNRGLVLQRRFWIFASYLFLREDGTFFGEWNPLQRWHHLYKILKSARPVNRYRWVYPTEADLERSQRHQHRKDRPARIPYKTACKGQDFSPEAMRKELCNRRIELPRNRLKTMQKYGYSFSF